MKKLIFIFAIICTILIVSCRSAQQKEAAARENVADANQNLKETQASNTEEWAAFKIDANAKIASNEQRISELKVEMNKPGKTFDGIYRTRIEKLEAKNAELKSKLRNYDGNETGWQTFKKDFNRDMNEIGNNIKDLFR